MNNIKFCFTQLSQSFHVASVVRVVASAFRAPTGRRALGTPSAMDAIADLTRIAQFIG
jgi:hypothetical protein